MTLTLRTGAGDIQSITKMLVHRESSDKISAEIVSKTEYIKTPEWDLDMVMEPHKVSWYAKVIAKVTQTSRKLFDRD